jgi:hypothetical protein
MAVQLRPYIGHVQAMECRVVKRDGREGNPCCMQEERRGHMIISLKI